MAAGVITAEKEASMQPVGELVVLLGRGVPAASIKLLCGLALVPYLVIRCDSVPKVGTVPPLDLHFTLNIRFNINISISLSR